MKGKCKSKHSNYIFIEGASPFPAGTVSSLHDVRYKVSDSLSLAPHKCMLATNPAYIAMHPPSHRDSYSFFRTLTFHSSFHTGAKNANLAHKKNRGPKQQRHSRPLPSDFSDIGESLSAYLQAIFNILQSRLIVKFF